MTEVPAAGVDAYCVNCGNGLAAGARACPRCGYEVRTDGTLASATAPHASAAIPVAPATSAFTPSPAVRPSTVVGPPRIGDTGIVLGDGERLWKQYAVTRLPAFKLLGINFSRATGNGTLYVTNSRVLFYASYAERKRNSRLIQETRVEQVTGISAFVARRSSFLAALAIFLCALLGLVVLVKGSAGGGLLLLVIAGIGAYLLSRRRPTVGVTIYSSASEASPLSFGRYGDSRGLIGALLGAFAPGVSGSKDAYELKIAPAGPHAEQAILELGALIADLQAKGDLAGMHWGMT